MNDRGRKWWGKIVVYTYVVNSKILSNAYFFILAIIY